MNKMLEKIPTETVQKNAEFIPGGDFRSSQNLWLRSAWTHSGLKKVPREKQIKMIVTKITRKKKLCNLSEPLTPSFLGTCLNPHSGSSLVAEEVKLEWIREQVSIPHFSFVVPDY